MREGGFDFDPTKYLKKIIKLNEILRKMLWFYNKK